MSDKDERLFEALDEIRINQITLLQNQSDLWEALEGINAHLESIEQHWKEKLKYRIVDDR